MYSSLSMLVYKNTDVHCLL